MPADVVKFGDGLELDRNAYVLRRTGGDRVKIAASEDIALRKAFEADGARGFWQRMQKETEKLDAEIGEFDLPLVYARLGEKEKALAELEGNYEERRPLGTLLNVDPAFDSLRSDPRFGDLVRRMGLTPNAQGLQREIRGQSLIH
jgi:hypothetical protein